MPGLLRFSLSVALVAKCALFALFIFGLHVEVNAQTVEWKKLNEQGEEYYNHGEYDKALEVFIRALPFAEKEFGKNHSNYALACDNLAFMHTMLGHYDLAEPLFLQSKSLREKLVGKNHQEYATTCINLADLYNAQGLYSKAEPLYQEGVVVFKKVYGDESNEYALAINNLAGMYFTLGNYKQTEIYYLKAQEIWSKTQGKESQDYATACNNLGSLYQQVGDYRKAEKAYIESKTIQEKLTGKNGSAYATSCNNLGDLYREYGEYVKSEALYLEGMEIRRKVLGEEHQLYAQSCMNAGLLYDDLGQYGRAEHLLVTSRNVYLKAVGKGHPEYAGVCNQLAVHYRLLGNNIKAESFYLEALDVFGKVVGKNHSDYAQAENDLAGFYRSIGEYNKSEKLYLDAKKIRTDLYGREHPSYGATCNNLALLYYAKGEYAKAEPLYLEAFEIIKKNGTDNSGYGRNRNNLAQLYNMQGNVAAAEPLYEECRQSWERTLGKKHPDYALICTNFGTFYSDHSKFEKAKPLFDESINIQLSQIEQNFKSLSANEQRNYLKTIQFYFTNYTAYAIKYYPQNKAMAGDLYNLRLSTKGLIFNSAVKTRLKILASGDTSMLHKYETERSLRNLLAKVYGMSAAERAKKNIDEQQLEEQANALEKELHEQSEKYQIKGLQGSVRPTWQQVKSKLKKKEATVEIVQVMTKKDTIYVALILKGAIDDLPEMVRLETGGKLEKKSIHYYRNCIQNQVEDTQSYDAFWKPLSPRLKGMKKIYFSADGVYHQINLSTLKNPSTGKYLGDEENIQLVGSIRELIDERKASKAIKAELFGYPDYRGDGKVNNADSNDRGASSSSLTNELTDGFSRYFNLESGVPSLPGTQTEVNIIDQQFKEHHVPEELFTGVLANEKQIKAVKDPRILHIATHGFFLPNASANINSGSTDTDLSLLYRSGLLLAGCERSMKGYGIAAGEEDGILTAYEAMNLFLDETELVVLSACETGLGIEQNGEGVQGLQRAFLEAGARTVLTSLWKVDDTATQLLMTTFYKEYLSSHDEKQSFQKAQKVVRSKYSHPYYWGAFVMMGK